MTGAEFRAEIIAGYEAYQRGEGRREREDLVKLVKDFIYLRIYRLELDFAQFGTDKTVDDFAQEAAIKVWNKLLDGFIATPECLAEVRARNKRDDFDGTPECFYRWVTTVAKNRGISGFRYLKRQKKRKAPVMVPSDVDGEPDGEPDGAERENPAIHQASETIDGNFTIPNSVQGLDRSIARLILDGRKQAEIGQILSIKEQSVKDRLRRLRKVLGNGHRAEREEQKRRNLALQEEAATFRIGKEVAA